MGRLVLIIVMLLISGVIYLLKAGASKITGKEVDFQDESRKVMQTTAKGINWMNEQWEKAKQESGNNPLPKDFSSLTATEIIYNVKSNPSKYNNSEAEAVYIEQAVAKMNNRQFDDARKLVQQLQEGQAKNFMLDEIEQKQNA